MPAYTKGCWKILSTNDEETLLRKKLLIWLYFWNRFNLKTWHHTFVFISVFMILLITHKEILRYFSYLFVIHTWFTRVFSLIFFQIFFIQYSFRYNQYRDTRVFMKTHTDITTHTHLCLCVCFVTVCVSWVEKELNGRDVV